MGTARQVLTAIIEALRQGNLPLVVELLWLSIKLCWLNGETAILLLWLRARNFFVGVAISLWFGARAAIVEVRYELKVGWIDTKVWWIDTKVWWIDTKIRWIKTTALFSNGWLDTKIRWIKTTALFSNGWLDTKIRWIKTTALFSKTWTKSVGALRARGRR